MLIKKQLDEIRRKTRKPGYVPSLLDDIDELRGLIREAVNPPITEDTQTLWRIKVRAVLDG